MCVCCSVHSLSAANEVSKQQLLKLQSHLAAEREKSQKAGESVKRLSRKFLLASKVLNTSVSIGSSLCCY